MRKQKRVDNDGKKRMKKSYKVLLAIVILVGLFGSCGKSNKDVTGVQETTETIEMVTEPELTKEDEIMEAVLKVIREENLVEIKYIPENNFLWIKYIDSSSSKRSTFLYKLTMVLKELQGIADTKVDIDVLCPLVDKYGNPSNEIVIRSTFSLETLEKINFDYFLSDNLPEVADIWNNHMLLDK